MPRVLMLLAMSSLALSAAAYMPLAQAASLTAGQLEAGPTYHYILKEDQNPSVCKHMLQVFNDKFTRPWLAPPLSFAAQQGGADPVYSPHSKYAFPRLPGVKFSAKMAFNWRYFSQPSSSEFAAIHWQEGMAFPGGCPAGATCSGEQPFPVLIAHFDFDNDGKTDTVIVEG